MENSFLPPFGCVLLVDDDPITNFVNQKILLKEAFADHVHVLDNGEEALQYIEEECDEVVKKP
jgi:CheY-like chemotaxis protein